VQTKPTAPAEQAKPNAAAEQTKPNPSAEPQPKSEPAAGEPKSNAKAPPSDSDTVAEQAGSQILINIDKSTQEMTVFVDGLEKYAWPVSTGKRGYSTPSGNYSALSMNETWYSKEWDNAPMPHAIFYMKDGHAIHGSYEVKHLGAPASHGCVRLAPKNAKTLFDLVKKNGLKNTQVVLVGTTPGGEAKVAAQPAYPDYGGGPWPGYGRGNYPPPRYYPPPRRGLFGGWFRQPYGGPQGYYRPPRGYYPPY
jgi:lipoprotein-anchoring transpeptidase ErfK/SrfK